MNKTVKININQRFERLVVLEKLNERDKIGNIQWLCKCDCGKTTTVAGTSLVHGRTRSCGCLAIEVRTRINKRTGTRLYSIWKNMKKRCLNENDPNYPSYGGRGIKICDEWVNDFEKFKQWSLKNGYKDNLTIDRINNDGNYSPENCRWADWFRQARNTRKTIRITNNSVTKSIDDWCEIKGLSKNTVLGRIKRGWDEKDLLKPVQYEGEPKRRALIRY